MHCRGGWCMFLIWLVFQVWDVYIDVWLVVNIYNIHDEVREGFSNYCETKRSDPPNFLKGILCSSAAEATGQATPPA